MHGFDLLFYLTLLVRGDACEKPPLASAHGTQKEARNGGTFGADDVHCLFSGVL